MSTTRLDTSRSKALHDRAKSFLPGGVTGDGRSSQPYPIIFESGQGKWLRDVDGNTYLDFHGGFGSAALGYAHPEVDAAVENATKEVGAVVGVPHVHEERLAERLTMLLPLADCVAFCGGGGSDAVYHAVRVARAATGRTKIVKVEGGYQGWHADVGVSVRPHLDDPSDSGVPEAQPNSSGSLEAVTSEVLVVTVNDGEMLEALFEERADEIAGMIIEPVIFSMGCVHVDPAYLQLTRDLCSKHGAVLIFDEIMCGFRGGLRGVGERLGVMADLGTFGKAIANGYVIAVLAGKNEFMRQLTPDGGVFYSGTFNGHPLSVIAAETTLNVLERDEVPKRLSQLSDRVEDEINDATAELGLNATCQSFGSVWNLYFHTTSVRNYRDLAQADLRGAQELNERYRVFLRERGIYVHRRHTNRAFIGGEHDAADIDRLIGVVREFLEANHEELAL